MSEEDEKRIENYGREDLLELVKYERKFHESKLKERDDLLAEMAEMLSLWQLTFSKDDCKKSSDLITKYENLKAK